MSANCQLGCCKHETMKTILDRRAFLALLAAGVAAGGAAGASDREDPRLRDHDRARHALEEGRVRPLLEILQKVRHRLGGEVIGIEFEQDDGRFVYELKIITPQGRLREVHVDAMSGEILKDEED